MRKTMRFLKLNTMKIFKNGLVRYHNANTNNTMVHFANFK